MGACEITKQEEVEERPDESLLDSARDFPAWSTDSD